MGKNKVLLIDDDPDFAGAVKTALESRGFEVQLASDGLEGIQLAKRFKPDAVVLDVMMPKKDGFAICYDLKQNEATSSIPVLMLTSLGKKGKGKDGAELLSKGHGAEGYLEKPVEPDVLVQKLRDLMEKADVPQGQNPKVLIIDDDSDFVSAVRTILEENGYRTVSSASGEDGILAAGQERPDIILLDVMLPGKDGYAVCRELKQGERTRNTPIIMVTAVGKKLVEPDYAKAMSITHKADDHIEKPVETEELLKRIRNLIGPMRRLV